MRLSIFNSSPLVADLASQRRALRQLARQAALFALFVFAIDFCAGQALFAGLARYFYFDKNAEALFVGHSRTLLGFDEELLEKSLGRPVAKFAVNGANTFDRAAMIRYFLDRSPGVRLVVYDVESSIFNTSNLASNSYRLFLPLIQDPGMAAYIEGQSPDRFSFFFAKMFHLARYDETTLWLALRGLAGFRENLKTGNLDIDRLRREIQYGKTRPTGIDPDNKACFEDTLRYIVSKGADVLLVNMPAVDLLNCADGEDGHAVSRLFAKYAEMLPGVHYVDLRSRWESNYDLFVDGIHMNAKGREALTGEILPIARQAIRQNDVRRSVAGGVAFSGGS